MELQLQIREFIVSERSSMVVKFNRNMSPWLGEKLVFFGGQGIMALTTESKGMLFVHALFRPVFIPPLLPIRLNPRIGKE
jgi:predicted histidine transporter YuiF (NhaC family)